MKLCSLILRIQMRLYIFFCLPLNLFTPLEQNMPYDHSDIGLWKHLPLLEEKLDSWDLLFLPKMLATSSVGNETIWKDKQSWSTPAATSVGALLFD